ncbi:MAG TPA: glycosyltransferase family A protein, partial [Caulobacteraceae bacterium]|nr:glycosyltransferase family A protein [Caulobacteraceae bacterium]
MSVAVIIAARDAEATIGRAVRGALAQPEASQVIVVDDGSLDRTSAAADAAADGSDRLVIERLETSGGPSRARNLALSLARAPYVCVLDADDFMLPGRLACLLGRIDGRDMIADDLLRVDEGAEDGIGAPMLGLEDEREVTLAQFLDGNISRPELERAE